MIRRFYMARAAAWVSTGQWDASLWPSVSTGGDSVNLTTLVPSQWNYYVSSAELGPRSHWRLKANWKGPHYPNTWGKLESGSMTKGNPRAHGGEVAWHLVLTSQVASCAKSQGPGQQA